MNEDLQQKYLEYQQLTNQLNYGQQQILQLEKQYMELDTLNNALEDVKNTKEGTEIIASLGSGLYIKTSLKSNSKIIMHVGANTNVTKTPDDAKKVIEDQMEQLKKIIGDMRTDLQKGVVRMQQLQKELAKKQQGEK
ncbi:MAG: prefoldin subunit alpha [Nanoarchaeota archaeon]|nr:prefoldin subunit alpha [Nanoarchaeota archaeon]MBU4352446.1 prefoldin subunit alpha [Nanoarchaeota archaeon]MBU4456959.1 prefoldin subunit alpha [Nanoarchaeota archaeon]MCG2720038.1 prefoldin subunit alpha [Nanoarchaeota archaeon]